MVLVVLCINCCCFFMLINCKPSVPSRTSFDDLLLFYFAVMDLQKKLAFTKWVNIATQNITNSRSHFVLMNKSYVYTNKLDMPMPSDK